MRAPTTMAERMLQNPLPIRQNSKAIGTDTSGAAVRTIHNILNGITDSVNRLSEIAQIEERLSRPSSRKGRQPINEESKSLIYFVMEIKFRTFLKGMASNKLKSDQKEKNHETEKLHLFRNKSCRKTHPKIQWTIREEMVVFSVQSREKDKGIKEVNKRLKAKFKVLQPQLI